jgi:cysteinyl-tRNA synthetase
VPAAARSPMLDDVERLERAFDTALAAGDGPGAVEAILQLDDVLAAWSTETFSSDEMAKARGALRSMVVRLGERAAAGLRDPRDVVGPFVDALLRMRVDLRSAKQFELADAVRDQLAGLGVEVRDTPAGAEWHMP